MRFHSIDGVRVQYTPAEETARDAVEAAIARGPSQAVRNARATAAADRDMASPLMQALADTLLSDTGDMGRFRAALETRHRAVVS